MSTPAPKPHVQQFAFRAQKQMGLIGGTPDYVPVEAFQKPDAFVRTFQYSPDGSLLALALPTCVRIVSASTGEVTIDIPVENAIEINFSPRSAFISTWERPIKIEEGAVQHKNFKVWAVADAKELISFTQKLQDNWDLQYTSSESHAVRLSGPEVQIFNPADWSRGVVDKLRVEGVSTLSVSPGRNPAIAVFIGEKKGAPASIRIYLLQTLAAPPTCQKTFYKADRIQIKWNALGTQALFLTQTEVDKTNKSYYGETGLYLLSASGNFDCRVTLDKEGPIHDFAWSPNSKEFGVVYGYMPAKTMLFDQRVKAVHDFGSAPHNFISFNPHSRLVALAGFGNLAGKIDIHDRRTLAKVCTIDAPNTSHFEWSEDGRFILTATLSPRLRVDNGIKIWHCTGGLMHIQDVDELYQAGWRPAKETAPWGQSLPVAPQPAASTASAPPKKVASDKPAGAYRPPGALGRAAPSIFKREDEGGAAFGSGTNTPPRGGPNGHGHHHSNGSGGSNLLSNAANAAARKQRYVPGAPPPDSGAAAAGDKKPRKKREKKDSAGGSGDRPRTAGGTPAEGEERPRASRGGERDNRRRSGDIHVATAGLLHVNVAATSTSAPVTPGEPAATPGGDTATLDPLQKKVRNLNKKLKAIDELKEKARRGEKLEATQLKKMDGEQEIKKELAAVLVSIEQSSGK
jgi:translation initiation factor 2A